MTACQQQEVYSTFEPNNLKIYHEKQNNAIQENLHNRTYIIYISYKEFIITYYYIMYLIITKISYNNSLIGYLPLQIYDLKTYFKY